MSEASISGTLESLYEHKDLDEIYIYSKGIRDYLGLHEEQFKLRDLAERTQFFFFASGPFPFAPGARDVGPREHMIRKIVKEVLIEHTSS